jgi:xanthine dehydrogenase accessory factor
MAQIAAALLAREESFALATIIDSRGSTPRHTGASMLVRADRSITGTIGGGPLEAAVIDSALSALTAHKALVLHYDSAQLGMICGGGNLALMEYVDAAKAANRQLYEHLSTLLASGRRGWLVTFVQGGETGDASTSKCLVDSDGTVYGEVIHPLESLQILAKRGGTYDGIVAGDPARTFVQPVGARGTAYVFGAGHCGEKLVPVLSSVGFFTVVVDDRADFANEDRFPAADRIVVPESFDTAVAGLPIDDDSYVVIVTRGHAHDKSVLAQTLRTDAAYIGMIGSVKKVAQTYAALREQGFTEDEIARVHAPIGLSIGAETPEEIAVSIAAQLIQVRHERSTE